MKSITAFLGAIILLVMITSCQQNQAEEQTVEEATVDLKAALQGTWQTYQINVAVNSADGKDTFRTESLTEAIWKKRFLMEPPVYYFQADQKYRLVHRNMDGLIVDQSRGMWNTFGDTLVLIEPDATYNYRVKLGEGKAAFRTFLDWDDDGETDDEFQSLNRQISIGVEDEE